jgi:hypothetical protein
MNVETLQRDYFDFPDEIPEEVQNVLKSHENDEEYSELSSLVSDLNEIGWTCEYYLDAEPYHLRPLAFKPREIKYSNDLPGMGFINP